jgi:protein-tyrosine phosphatase
MALIQPPVPGRATAPMRARYALPMAFDAPATHRERFVALCGTCNARDLGGLPLARGGVTRGGRYFRADAPLRLDAGDAEALVALGVTTVLDLREPGEVDREPSALADHPGLNVEYVDIWSGLRAAHAARGRPEDPWDLATLYVTALDHAGADFVRALEHLAAAEGAALFHCTVGKDRTGLLAALLLESVGVARETVLEDYALTHDRIDAVRVRLLAQSAERGIRPEDYARLLGATPDVLGHALAHLDREHGGARTYLLRAGAEGATLARLEERLT